MLNKVIFYCSWHHGDWHLAKEFVRNFVTQLQAGGVECLAVTSRDPHIVNIAGLPAVNIEGYPALRENPFTHWDAATGTFFVNIWVGYYGLAGGNGGNHNFVNQRDMWKSIASHIEAETGFHLDTIEDPELTVPDIDVSELGVYAPAPENSVFFANSMAWSGQTLVNTMPNAIHSLAKEFPTVNFICTQDIDVRGHNMFYTDDLTYRSNVGYNPLPEAAKISEGCRIVVTNCSGPGTFAMTRKNFDDPDKTMLVLLTNEGLSPHTGVRCNAKMLFSSTYDEWEVGRIVRQEILDKNMNA